MSSISEIIREQKLISIVTPCYNEENNINEVYQQVQAVFEKLPQYDYEHIFIDNDSNDGTVTKLRLIANNDKRVKIIRNTRNFGPVRSPYYGLLQAHGDAVICLSADLQEPPSLIISFLDRWEQGFKIVAGVKTQSHESKIKFKFRKLCYRFLARIADISLIKNFHGFGLYDKSVIAMFRQIEDPYPFLRGLVSELGFKISEIPYQQQPRFQGKSKASLYGWYDWGMLSITSHSKFPIRLMTIFGFCLAALSLFLSFVFIFLKLLFWSKFSLGIAPLLVGLFFFSSIQLFFIGLIGEYIISINRRVMKRPLVVEEERINFYGYLNESQ